MPSSITLASGPTSAFALRGVRANHSGLHGFIFVDYGIITSFRSEQATLYLHTLFRSLHRWADVLEPGAVRRSSRIGRDL